MSYQHLVIVRLLNFSHFNAGEIASQHNFDFSCNSDAGHIFMCSLVHLNILFYDILVQAFCLFKKFVFLFLICRTSLHILTLSPLSDKFEYFYPVPGLPSHILKYVHSF